MTTIIQIFCEDTTEMHSALLASEEYCDNLRKRIIKRNFSGTNIRKDDV